MGGEEGGSGVQDEGIGMVKIDMALDLVTMPTN